MESELLKNLEYVIHTANIKHDHVPRVANSALFPFPFEACRHARIAPHVV